MCIRDSVSDAVPVPKVRFSWRVLKEVFRSNRDFYDVIVKEQEVTLGRVQLPLGSLRHPKRIPLAWVIFERQQPTYFVKSLRSLDDYFATVSKEYSSWGQLVNSCDYVCQWSWEGETAILKIVPIRDWQRFVEDYAKSLCPDLLKFYREKPKVELAPCFGYFNYFVVPPGEPFFVPVRRHRVKRLGETGWIEVEVLRYFKSTR